MTGRRISRPLFLRQGDPRIKILMEFLLDFDVIPSSGLLKRIEKAYTESVLKSPSDLIEGSSEILRFLKNKKYKLGLICNTGRSPGKVLRNLLAHYQISEYFDVLSTWGMSSKRMSKEPKT